MAPGWSFSNFLPSVVKLSFNEAAAKTVTSPDTAPEAPDDAEEPCEDCGDESGPDDEQALRASSAAAPAPAARSIRRGDRAERLITDPLPQGPGRTGRSGTDTPVRTDSSALHGLVEVRRHSYRRTGRTAAGADDTSASARRKLIFSSQQQDLW
ncbi:hypothetical protein GCM10018787_16280 [Streptomyces thermodiastaticus]|nr:hypothetical protein GCM10018787_16280 [Streptomyces thermodiastaticus]